jgi:hypothetical protein
MCVAQPLGMVEWVCEVQTYVARQNITYIVERRQEEALVATNVQPAEADQTVQQHVNGYSCKEA